MLVVNEARIESLNGEKHETESFRVHPANTDSRSKKNQMRIYTDYKASLQEYIQHPLKNIFGIYSSYSGNAIKLGCKRDWKILFVPDLRNSYIKHPFI